ncbi:MAG: tyrosine--tRNA ligase [Spirochaetes bacterium]|nr:tyrosine--tRNA ligase [Spirochaetota bacterium]
MLSANEQLELIKRGTVEIISEEELIEKIKNSIKTKKPLVVKAGFDPTAPDLHLGHTVLLRKMAHFQELGHRVVFLIGDYTGMIGDPTGRSKTRNQLTEGEVKKNADTYRQQISRILDINKLEIVFNSSWLKKMDLRDIIELSAKQTVARLLERDDFFKRYKNGDDISMLEFLYPLLQAYDSVQLKADIELGGTDQKFNLLLGRTIQKRYDQPPQVILTMPLLEGTDGLEKMSKSYGNYIGINENSKDMFGKIMSIPDTLLFKYLELLTDIDRKTIEQYKKDIAQKRNPKEIKVILAKDIVARYYDNKTADKEETNFNLLFSKKEIPEDIPEIDLFKELDEAGQEYTASAIAYASATLLGKNMSKSEIKRLIKQGGVDFDNEQVKDEWVKFKKSDIKDGMIIRIGKKIIARHRH